MESERDHCRRNRSRRESPGGAQVSAKTYLPTAHTSHRASRLPSLGVNVWLGDPGPDRIAQVAD